MNNQQEVKKNNKYLEETPKEQWMTEVKLVSFHPWSRSWNVVSVGSIAPLKRRVEATPV